MVGAATLFYICILLVIQPSVSLYEATWTLTQGFATPDCVERNVILINGELNGPEIRVQPNEEIRITLINDLPFQAIGIHWHGMKQYGNVWADGAGMMTECPIPPHTSVVIEFRANPAPGSYFYHAHVSSLRTGGTLGALTVEGPISEYDISDADHTLVLTDWYHAPLSDIVSGLKAPRFRWAGDPQSVLINGKGNFGNCTSNTMYSCTYEGECSDSKTVVAGAESRPYYIPWYHPVDNFCTTDCHTPEEFVVESGNTYLLRLINAGSLSGLAVAVESHTLTIIELDGQPIEPMEVDSVLLHSGQRAGVLLTANQPADAYVLRINIIGRGADRPTNAYIVYDGVTERPVDPAAIEVANPAWDDFAPVMEQNNGSRGLPDDMYDVIPEPTKRFVFLGTQERFNTPEKDYSNLEVDEAANLSVEDMFFTDTADTFIGTGDNRPENSCDSHDNTWGLLWGVSRNSFQKPRSPVLPSIYFDLDADIYTPENGYFELETGGVYDIVIQNYPACNGVCETHAWHMHGHSFWVLGHGTGTWRGTEDQIGALNTINPPKRDTTIVIPDATVPFASGESRDGCGYTVIRFEANNPGAWFFHCHQNWHVVMGMNVLFHYGVDTLNPPPVNFRTCGDLDPATIFASTDCSTDDDTETDAVSCADFDGMNHKCKHTDGCKYNSNNHKCKSIEPEATDLVCSDLNGQRTKCKNHGCKYNSNNGNCREGRL